ncbi:hypothetical protein EDB65_102266 [Vibrio crassostreae]|nr:hypothetical protein EDB65_102266 [Vibrio crassostreae]
MVITQDYGIEEVPVLEVTSYSPQTRINNHMCYYRIRVWIPK